MSTNPPTETQPIAENISLLAALLLLTGEFTATSIRIGRNDIMITLSSRESESEVPDEVRL